MKKFMVLILTLVLLFPSIVQAERWGKAFDVTYEEFNLRYANAPNSIYGEEMPLVFIDLGASDYRRTYFAEVKPAFNIAILCEDFSDKVVFAYISIVFDKIADYDEAVVIGKKFINLSARLLFSIDESMGPAEAGELLNDEEFFNEVLLNEGLQKDKAFGNMYFVAVNNGKEAQLIVRRNDFYETKEEFLDYVDTYK